MSVHVLSWVLRNSPARLGARLVLIVLADHAREDGSAAWPSVDTIAREARLSRRAVQDALRLLEHEGAIVPSGTSRAGTTVYNVVIQGGADSAPRGADYDTAGAQDSHPGGADAAPEPSVTVREPSDPPTPLKGGAPAFPVRPASRRQRDLAEYRDACAAYAAHLFPHDEPPARRGVVMGPPAGAVCVEQAIRAGARDRGGVLAHARRWFPELLEDDDSTTTERAA